MARQYTGRMVTVSNGLIFTEPVYNYSRDFPFIWEEIHVGVGYDDRYEEAENILLEVARNHTQKAQKMSDDSRKHLHRIYNLTPPDVQPRVFYRMTDNWVELAVRFIVPDRGIRELKDAMYRDILRRFKSAGISIASGTYDIVGFPPVRIAWADPSEAQKAPQ